MERINLIAGILSATAALIALVSFATPLLVPPEAPKPDLRVDLIPTQGEINEDRKEYNTWERPHTKDIWTDLKVVMTNKGIKAAENVKVALYHSPQYNTWYDFHSAKVVEGTPLQEFKFSGDDIPIIFPGEKIVVDYTISISPILYDEVLQKGDEPTINLQVDYAGADSSINREYVVKLPS